MYIGIAHYLYPQTYPILYYNMDRKLCLSLPQGVVLYVYTFNVAIFPLPFLSNCISIVMFVCVSREGVSTVPHA